MADFLKGLGKGMTPERRRYTDRMDDQRLRELERKVDVLTERMDTDDDWVSESRIFHRDMNDFKSTFIATQKAIREEQNRRHESNSAKLNMIVAFTAIGMLILTAFGIYVSVQVANHKAVNLFEHSSISPPVEADATLPPTYQAR